MADKASQPDPSTSDGSEADRTSTDSANPLSDRRLFANVGKGLRAVYMDTLREPLPQAMKAILKKIGPGRE